MESQIRREKNDFTNAKKRTDELNRRLKENREKLKLNTQLPHMVANVGEILEPEEEDLSICDHVASEGFSILDEMEARQQG